MSNSEGCSVTSHADTHDGRHGANDNGQENDEDDQVAAEQDPASTVQPPPVSDVQGQNADPPVTNGGGGAGAVRDTTQGAAL